MVEHGVCLPQRERPNRLAAFSFATAIFFASSSCKPAPESPKPLTQSATIEIPTISPETDAFFPIQASQHFFSLIDRTGTELIEKSRYTKCSRGHLNSSGLFPQFMGQESVLLLSKEKWLFITQGSVKLLTPACATSEVNEVLNFGESVFRIDCRKPSNPSSFVFDPFGKWSTTDLVPLRPFQEGKCVVRSNDKIGFVDRNGRFVVQPTYDAAQSFSDGLAAVKTGELWGYIDESGTEVIEPQFAGVSEFENGIALARRPSDKQLEQIDGTGKRVGPFTIDPDSQFEELRGFQDGNRFYRGGQSQNGEAIYGLVSRRGEIVLQPSLLYPGPFARFADDHLVVRVLTPRPTGAETLEYRIMNRRGELGASVKRAFWNPFALGLACDRTCECGYIDSEGNTVWKP
ncbi:MAG: WG repeat-containing protein [Planctomycetota bacterium]